MANVQFGTVVGLRRFRGLYEGSDTLRAGMALCYNYDTTTNYLGANKAHTSTTLSAEAIEGATTADGNQNEGKFMRLEKPAAANVKFLAGLVAGPMGPKTGPSHVDMYDLNDSGACVVWSVSNVTAGDPLFVTAGLYSVDTVGDVFVGYAMETVNRSSTNGLVLMYANRSASAAAPTVNTADFTVDGGDHGKTFTNLGDTGAQVATLPAASTVPGLEVTFVVEAIQTIAITPATGDKIIFGNGSDVLADSQALTLTPGDANDYGMNITIVSNGDNWSVKSAWATGVALFVIP